MLEAKKDLAEAKAILAADGKNLSRNDRKDLREEIMASERRLDVMDNEECLRQEHE